MRTKHIIIASASIIGFALVASSAMAKLQVQTEEECVKSKAGHACSQQVFAHAVGAHQQRIHCGDSVVYGTNDTKKLIEAHVEEGRNVILVEDGDYKDGYCY